MKAREVPQDRLTYTMAEACARLGISEDLGYQLAREGEIPILQLGRRKLIPRAALERMVARAEQAWEDNRDHRAAPDQFGASLDRAGGPGTGSAHRQASAAQADV